VMLLMQRWRRCLVYEGLKSRLGVWVVLKDAGPRGVLQDALRPRWDFSPS